MRKWPRASMRARSYHASPGICQANVLCISLWIVSMNMLVSGCTAVDGRGCGKVGNRRANPPHRERGRRLRPSMGGAKIHSRAVRLGPGERHRGLPAPVATLAAATRDYAPPRPLQGAARGDRPAPTARLGGVVFGADGSTPSLFAPGSRPMRHVSASPSTAVMDNYAGRPAARPGNASWSGRRWRGSYAADGIAIAPLG
jgi:hypothetical protein